MKCYISRCCHFKAIFLLLACLALFIAVPRSAAQGYCMDCSDPWLTGCSSVGGQVFSEAGQCLCWGAASPIIIETRGEGIKLTPAAEGVVFDLTGNGKPARYSWAKAGTGNAFLALDRNGNGRIESGLELFGNFTAQPPSPQRNGFLALAEFDKPENGGNADGIIDNYDAVFAQLRLWIDANHNGISEPEELFPLLSLGINSISLTYSESERRDRFGNRFRYRSKVNVGMPRASEEAGPFAYDVFLAAVPLNVPTTQAIVAGGPGKELMVPRSSPPLA